jgi:hypothetical protein
MIAAIFALAMLTAIVGVVAVVGATVFRIVVGTVRSGLAAGAPRLGEIGTSRGPVFRGSRETEERLERLEQAMDAMAIEVERVAEGQRFLTKLLAERPSEPRAREGPPAHVVGASTATQSDATREVQQHKLA